MHAKTNESVRMTPDFANMGEASTEDNNIFIRLLFSISNASVDRGKLHLNEKEKNG